MKITTGIESAGEREQRALTLHRLAGQTLASQRVLVCPATPMLCYTEALIIPGLGRLRLGAKRDAILAKELEREVGKKTVRAAGFLINRY